MKLTTPTMLFVSLMLSATLTAGAESFSDGNLSYQILSGNTVSVAPSSQGKYSGAIEIPSTVTNEGTTYTVVAIADKAFQNCSGVISVTMPSTLTSIGEYAFDMCSGITELTFPADVTTIGVYAMQGCNKMTTVTLPEKLTAISNGLFVGCEKIESITIPASVTRIGDWAFNYATALKDLVFPDAVKTIGEGAFYGCSGLTNIKLGKNVETISNSAFSDCSELVTIDIPASVKAMGANVFTNCMKLESINVEEGNTIMASYHGVIYSPDLKNLQMAPPARKVVTVPDQTVKINSYSFVNCSVEKVLGCRNLLTIDEFAFSGCRSLNYIELGDKLTELREEALASTSIEYVNLPATLQTIGIRAFNDCRELKSVVVPDNVTEVGNYGFFGCTSLRTVVLGKGVTSIGEYPFRMSGSLESLTCRATKPAYIYPEDFTDAQYQSIKLYVPSTAINAYKNAEGWKNFSQISAMMEGTLTLTAASVTATGAEVAGKPSDSNVYWYMDVKELSEYAGEDIWSQLVDEWKSAGEGWYDTYCAKAHKGEAAQSFTGLKENTVYAAYGFAVDSEGNLCMPVVTTVFMTKDDTLSLTLNVGNITTTSAQVTGSPSNDGVFWYGDVVRKSDFKGENTWQELLDGWKAAGEGWYETYCGVAHQGEYSNTYTGLDEETEYVAYGFAVNNVGNLVMPFVSVEFKTASAGSGITSVAVGAPKVRVMNNVIAVAGEYESAEAYTIDGRRAAVCRDGAMEVEPGVYVVRVRTAERQLAVKVIVR